MTVRSQVTSVLGCEVPESASIEENVDEVDEAPGAYFKGGCHGVQVSSGFILLQAHNPLFAGESQVWQAQWDDLKLGQEILHLNLFILKRIDLY